MSKGKFINWTLFVLLSFIWGSSFILIKEASQAVMTANLVGDRFVLTYSRDAQATIKVFSRAGRHERAIELWRRLASLGLTGCEPYVELAKHFEHRLHDYDAALEVVEEALALVEIRELRQRPGTATERAELEHRRTRLHQKRRKVAKG